MNPGKFYREELVKHESTRDSLAKKSRTVSVIRVIVFVLLTIGVIYLVNLRELQWSIILTLLLVTVMAFLIRWHNKIKYRLKVTLNTVDLITREQKRIELNFTGSQTGEEYNNDHHPYSSDLDLFGAKSVFQLVDQTTSYYGKDKLAHWLSNRSSKAEILKRQQAAKALSEEKEWCIHYRAVGLADSISKEQISSFSEWITEQPKLLQNKGIKVAGIILPLLFVVVAIGAFVFDYTLYTTLPILIISGILLNRNSAYTKDTVEHTNEILGTLRVLSHQLQLIEASGFTSEYLSEIKSSILQPYKASETIQHLHKLLDRLQTRNNMLHIFFNIAFLLDIWALLALEKWRKQNAERINDWFRSLAETEALISLSGCYFNFPDWSTPQFSEESYNLHGEEMRHPMLDAEAVSNSFRLSGEGNTYLITGPNMAGKSTFLRTVATNLILAQAGAPARATRFVINPDVQVFTAMRVKDNLNESVSSFYAELDRIKQLIDRISEGEKCLYFLDELLKGTNSADRHKGAESLIKQLHKLKATGFVSTHDLELGALASRKTYVHNYSFESTIEEGNITFDYTIREGISSSFNACELMRKMGIEVPE